MSLIGATGSLAFDNDFALADQPRRNASVVVGTCGLAPSAFRQLRTDRDFRPTGRFADDGSATTSPWRAATRNTG